MSAVVAGMRTYRTDASCQVTAVKEDMVLSASLIDFNSAFTYWWQRTDDVLQGPPVHWPRRVQQQRLRGDCQEA